MISKKLAMLAAVSMIATGSPAFAGPAKSLSLANSPAVQRAATAGHKKSGIQGTIVVAAIMVPVITVGTVLLLKRKEPGPKSP